MQSILLLAISMKAGEMLTYTLFKTQSMLLSATSTKGWWDVDLHAVQNPKHPLVKNKLEYPARCWLTNCSKPRACSCHQQAGRPSQMLTYSLFKTQNILLSETSRKGQPDADLQAVQNPEHPLFSNKHKRLVRCWLTFCSKPKVSSCQKQAGIPSQMLTHKLFKNLHILLSETNRKHQLDADLHPVKAQSMLLSATSRNDWPDADLHAVQNP